MKIIGLLLLIATIIAVTRVVIPESSATPATVAAGSSAPAH
jgi:hypothetical protein